MIDFENEEYIELDLNKIRSNISSFTSEKLCEMIICDRYFNSYNELAVICMEELATRRLAGDNFDFESFIENSFNELPKLDLSIPNIGNMLKQVIKAKNNE